MTSRTTLRAGVAVSLVALVTVATSACVGDTSNDRDTSTTATSDASFDRFDSRAGQGTIADAVGPTREEHGVPVGWSLDRVGAEAAAAAYVRSTSVVARSGPLTRRDVVLTIATEAAGPAMADSVSRDLDGLSAGVEGRAVTPSEVLWVEYPLTVTSTMTSPTDAVVRVWSVMVVGVEGGSLARQVWRTSTLTMSVERGDWKIADWTDTPGPSPVALNDTDLASVADVHEVSSWSTVRSGS